MNENRKKLLSEFFTGFLFAGLSAACSFTLGLIPYAGPFIGFLSAYAFGFLLAWIEGPWIITFGMVGVIGSLFLVTVHKFTFFALAMFSLQAVLFFSIFVQTTIKVRKGRKEIEGGDVSQDEP